MNADSPLSVDGFPTMAYKTIVRCVNKWTKLGHWVYATPLYGERTRIVKMRMRGEQIQALDRHGTWLSLSDSAGLPCGWKLERIRAPHRPGAGTAPARGKEGEKP